MHIRNEPRPTKPTRPNTNRIAVVVQPTSDKPQVRHAERILAARAEAARQPAIAAAIRADRLAMAITSAREVLNEAESLLAHLVVDEFPAEDIAKQKAAVATARAVLSAAEAAT